MSTKTNRCFRFSRVLKEFEHRSKSEMFECFRFLNGWRDVSMANEKWRWHYEIRFCFPYDFCLLFDDSICWFSTTSVHFTKHDTRNI